MTEQKASAGTPAGGTTVVVQQDAKDSGLPATLSATTAEASLAAFDWQAALGPAYVQHERLLQAKGWKGPAEVLASYAGLETLIGADKIALPAKEAPPEAWEGVWRRLGRPDTPEGYELQRPDDPALYSDAFADNFRSAAHAAGLTDRQAAALHDWWLGEAAELRKGEAEAAARSAAELERTLDKAWGGAKAEKLALAQRAARHFGLEAERIDRLERLVGDVKLMEGLAAIGDQLREDNLAGGKATFDAEGARAELKRLESDKDFTRAYLDRTHPDHAAAVERMTALAQRAFPHAASKGRS